MRDAWMDDDTPQAAYDPEERAVFDEIEEATGVDFGGYVRHHSRDFDWILSKEGLATIRELAEDDQRFFVFLSLLGPHHPYSMPEEWYYKIDPADVDISGLDRQAYLDSAPGRLLHAARNWGALTDDHFRLIIARQRCYVMYMDWMLGEILDELEDMGLLETTLIAFVTDHGVMSGKRGLFLKTDFDDAAVLTSFVLCHPTLFPEVGDFDGFLSNVDVLPTLAGLCGLPLLSWCFGEDLSEALLTRDPDKARDAVFSYMYLTPEQTGPQPNGMMIRTQRFKYTMFNPKRFPEGGPFEQLYDMQADPNELHNLVDKQRLAGRIEKLQDRMEQELASYWEPLFELDKS